MIAGRLRGPITGNAVGTLALLVSQTAFRFTINVGLAQGLGATGYGAYSFAIACVGVLAVPARLGLDGLLVRAVAAYSHRHEWDRLSGLLRSALRSATTASIGLSIAVAAVTWGLKDYLEPELVKCLWIGLFFLPLLTLLSLMRATLIGLQWVMAGQVSEMLVQPAIFVMLLATAAALPIASVDAPLAIGLGVMAALVAVLIATGISRTAWPAELRRAKPSYFHRDWMRSAISFITDSGLNVLSASLGVIMLGLMSGSTAAGIFGIVNAASTLIALPLMAINAPLAPIFSKSFAANNKAELQRLGVKSARTAFFLCLPLAMIYIVFGENLLRIFGEEYVIGYKALLILTVGQLINVATGPVGVLLQMTYHERDVSIVRFSAVIINVALNLALIPTLGTQGAAIGAATGMVVWNFWLAHLVRRKLGISCTVLA